MDQLCRKGLGFLVDIKLNVNYRASLRTVKHCIRFSSKAADIFMLGDVQNLTLQGPEKLQVGTTMSRTWARCSAEVPYNLYFFFFFCDPKF